MLRKIVVQVHSQVWFVSCEDSTSHASISSEGLSRQEEEEEEVASSSTDCKRHLSGGLAVLLNQVRAGCKASITSSSHLVVLAIPVRQELLEASPEFAERARHTQKGLC